MITQDGKAQSTLDEVTRDEMTTGDERVGGRDELQVDDVAYGQQW
jgi:hypothetical protein